MSKEPKENGYMIPVIVAIIGAVATIVVALINNYSPGETKSNSPDSTVMQQPITDLRANPSNRANSSNEAALPDNPVSHETPLNDVRLTTNNCEVSIIHPLVTLHEEPDRWSLESGKVPAGNYKVLAYTEKNEMVKKSRWLKVKVKEKEGWIEDNSWTINEKLGECP